MATARSPLRQAAQNRAARRDPRVNVNRNYSANSFRFPAGTSSAYKSAARGVLRSGGTVMQAAKAGAAANRRRAAGKGASSQGNS